MEVPVDVVAAAIAELAAEVTMAAVVAEATIAEVAAEAVIAVVAAAVAAAVVAAAAVAVAAVIEVDTCCHDIFYATDQLSHVSKLDR